MTCGTGKVCPPLAMSKNTSVLEKLGSLDQSVSTGKGGEGRGGGTDLRAEVDPEERADSGVVGGGIAIMVEDDGWFL